MCYPWCISCKYHPSWIGNLKQNIAFFSNPFFVLLSLTFCLFLSFAFCHLLLLCATHGNTDISLATPCPNHAHMSRHAFTDKTFFWRVNMRGRMKYDMQWSLWSVTSHYSVLSLPEEKSRHRLFFSSRLQRCLQKRSTRVDPTQDTFSPTLSKTHIHTETIFFNVLKCVHPSQT